ncbi:choice-of-anchor D domain-containing protein [Candidatus Binatus sp.]|uniref:choice-of-anchor D domain-containing protein n=1 Tax=Candidatus Binatus sp. TaxID=2811406 RepID=UPI002F91F040
MNKCAGKLRIGAFAILSAVAFFIMAAAAPTVPTTISVADSLDFPSSPVGDTATRNLTVTNTGKTSPLIIGSVTSSDPAEFAVGTSTCPSGGSGLAPGLACTIAIGFTPRQVDARRATLKISDNTATSPQSVALSGNGTITMAVSPTSYAFRDVQVGSKATKELTVQNLQANPVSLSEGFGGANAREFSVTGGTCTATLAAKSDCSLLVTFAPTAAGTELAFITVTDVPDPLGPYTVSFGALVTAAATPEPTP